MRGVGTKRTYKGKDYTSVASLAKDYDVCAGTLGMKLRSGMSIKDAIQSCKDAKIGKFSYRGINYANIDELAEALGLSGYTLRNRIYCQGMSLIEAVEIPPKRKRAI